MKFSGICLITEDVPALAKFYARLLACEPVGDATHAEFFFEGTSLAIFSRSGMEEMAPGCMGGAGTGCFTIGFHVADVDDAYERVRALEVEIVKPLQTHPWGTRSFWFRDPDGNIVDVFAQVSEKV